MQQRTPFPCLARVRAWWLLVVTVALSALGLPSPAQEAPPEKAVIRLTSPKPGMTFDAPGPIAFEGYAIDPAGDIRHLEFFANELPIGSSDFLSKIATIPGMTIPHHLVWEGIAPGSYKVVARGRDSLGNPVESEALPVEVTRPVSGRFQFVSSGAEWRYHNDGTDLGQKWRDPAFEDRSWPSGPSELGYGDGDEKTITRTEGTPHPLTAYFLHTFQVPADLNVARLEIRLVRDDGAVVYLNGKELLRDNLPDGEITFTTPASDSTENENRVRRFLVPADALVAGPNLLAVEVHQASPTSSDLSFDLQLVGLSSDTPSPLTPTVSLVGLNLATSESRPEARIAPGRISLRRTGDLTRDLAVFLGVSGTASPDLDFTALANPTLIPAGKAAVDLEIIALDDDLVEPTETVVVEIVPSPVAGPLPSYEADPEHARAAVEIRDADSPGIIAPVVSLVGLNLATSEPRPEARIAPGRLALRRTGDTDRDLAVLLAVSGSATPGKDYPAIENPAVIPAGKSEVELFVVAQDDDLVEGTETVRVALGIDPLALPIYALDPKYSEVEVEIHDADVASTASLVITSPEDGTTFPEGALIPVSVTAVDPESYIHRVELFDGEERIGVSELIFIVAPEPGTPIHHQFEWKGASAGEHKIVARASRGNDARWVSEPILIRVGKPGAVVTLTAPRAGAVFSPGTPIDLRATAIDPEGYIARVDFLAGDKVVASSQIAFLVAPPNGTPIDHQAVWEDAPAGDHVLTVRGLSAAGQLIASERVPIVVGDSPSPVTLEIVATDDEATENGSGQGADTATFVIRRAGGPKEVPVTAFYVVEGTARNGLDYVRLDGNATLRAGQDSTEITVRALPDRLTEPTETMVLTLVPPPCVAIFPPPPQCYVVNERHSAKAVILDADDNKGDENTAPVVTVVSPEPGAVFSEGDVIPLGATATDRDGTIERLDLFADDTLLGSSKDGTLKLEWSKATVGVHRLTARAVDNDGAESTSRPIPIYVRDVRERAFVSRDLPPAYLPGAVLQVQLVVNPPRGSAAWIVEETPPTNWVLGNLGDEGVFDERVGRIKFGPFTETTERTLTYQVTVPAGTEGTQKFDGTSSLDGTTFPVAGETAINPAGLHHPADAPSPDNSISGNEVTAYAAAWKLGKDWADSGLIPLSYVTRAGFIWRSGETYLFDAGRGAPPECWAPSGPRRLAPTALADHGHDTRRALPSAWRPGQPGPVELVIRPPSGTLATAVEEILPTGWHATSISDSGSYDSTTRTIRWGLLEGDPTRTLTYRAVPPSNAACTGTFSGRASFDGSEVAILGTHAAGATDESTALRIVGTRKERNGKPRLTIEAPAQQVFVIEGSSDLQSWSEISAHLHTGDDIEIDDPKAGSVTGHRYYRLRPVGR